MDSISGANQQTSGGRWQNMNELSAAKRQNIHERDTSGIATSHVTTETLPTAFPSSAFVSAAGQPHPPLSLLQLTSPLCLLLHIAHCIFLLWHGSIPSAS